MIRDNIRMSAEYDPSARAIPLYVWARQPNGELFAARPVVFEPVDETLMREPTLYLSLENANSLMDDLWRAGVRPTNIRNQSEIVNAKDRHIEDLRVFATKLLDKVVNA